MAALMVLWGSELTHLFTSHRFLHQREVLTDPDLWVEAGTRGCMVLLCAFGERSPKQAAVLSSFD